MLTQRIALLAERLGLSMPRVLGPARLGLSGTIRATQPVALSLRPAVEQGLRYITPELTPEELLASMNVGHVWVWAEAKDGDTEDELLTRASQGDIPESGLWIVLSGARAALRCVVDPSGALLVIGAQRPTWRPPRCRLLVAEFSLGPATGFGARGLFALVASQTRVVARTRFLEAELEHHEAEERDFIVRVRRHLETLIVHERETAPECGFIVIGRDPLRIQADGGRDWPRPFARAGALVLVPLTNGSQGMLAVEDISDDGDVLTLADDRVTEFVENEGVVELKPSDAPLMRMREALDTIAVGTAPSHRQLLAALVRPHELLALPEEQAVVDGADRQALAVATALASPDLALIHGPPGTGKTTVICSLIEELVRRRQRVLLVAPTHVALDNVLERVGDRAGVTAIRLGSPDNVEAQAQRFLLPNRSKDLARRLGDALAAATKEAPDTDRVATVQREWAARLEREQDVATMLLLNANLVCATPIGIAMAREFREVEVAFDVMIMDEASKATITDFLVPAARARKWILVGDHLQLAPHVEVDELAAILKARATRGAMPKLSDGWTAELATLLRLHFDNRMHPDPGRMEKRWHELVEELARPFDLPPEARRAALALGPEPVRWRAAQRLSEGKPARGRHDEPVATAASVLPSPFLRFGAEILDIQALALRSVFEHLTRLPSDRTVRLNRQHRMAPALAEFSAELVYGRDFPSAPGTERLGLPIPGLEAHSIWVDTAYAPSERRYEHPRDCGWRGGDYTNALEIRVALELVEACATWASQSWRGDQRPDGRGTVAPFEIGVIAFYLKQAQALREALFKRLRAGPDLWRRHWTSPGANGAPIDVHVSVVDRFQGREKDVVVLCTTRSNPDGVRGHVDNLNRLNVAVTRARHKRIVIGDSTTLAGQAPGLRRVERDLLRRLYETSETKKKWGRALGGTK